MIIILDDKCRDVTPLIGHALRRLSFGQTCELPASHFATVIGSALRPGRAYASGATPDPAILRIRRIR